MTLTFWYKSKGNVGHVCAVWTECKSISVSSKVTLFHHISLGSKAFWLFVSKMVHEVIFSGMMLVAKFGDLGKIVSGWYLFSTFLKFLSEMPLLRLSRTITSHPSIPLFLPKNLPVLRHPPPSDSWCFSAIFCLTHQEFFICWFQLFVYNLSRFCVYTESAHATYRGTASFLTPTGCTVLRKLGQGGPTHTVNGPRP